MLCSRICFAVLFVTTKFNTRIVSPDYNVFPVSFVFLFFFLHQAMTYTSSTSIVNYGTSE